MATRPRRRTATAASGPDRDAALEQYRRRARVYDLELAAFEPIRRDAVRRLAPRRGETVIDVGCGTGLSLPLLREAVGARGRVVGVEQSPEMLALARRRVEAHRWRNVELVGAPVEAADWRWPGDAALFHFVHDVLQRADAVENVLAHLKRGARVVASGLCWAPRWAVAVNAAVYLAARRSVTTLDGLERPWALLEQRLGVCAAEIGTRAGAAQAAGVGASRSPGWPPGQAAQHPPAAWGAPALGLGPIRGACGVASLARASSPGCALRLACAPNGAQRGCRFLPRRLPRPMRVTTTWLGAVYIAEGSVP